MWPTPFTYAYFTVCLWPHMTAYGPKTRETTGAQALGRHQHPVLPKKIQHTQLAFNPTAINFRIT